MGGGGVARGRGLCPEGRKAGARCTRHVRARKQASCTGQARRAGRSGHPAAPQPPELTRRPPRAPPPPTPDKSSRPHPPSQGLLSAAGRESGWVVGGWWCGGGWWVVGGGGGGGGGGWWWWGGGWGGVGGGGGGGGGGGPTVGRPRGSLLHGQAAAHACRNAACCAVHPRLPPPSQPADAPESSSGSSSTACEFHTEARLPDAAGDVPTVVSQGRTEAGGGPTCCSGGSSVYV